MAPLNTSPGRPEMSKHRAGRERTLRRGAERHQVGDLLDLDEAAAGDLCEHVGDVLLGHLVEDRGLGDGRRHAIDRDVVARQIPCPAISSARSRPALEAEYAQALGLPSLPAIDAMLTMRP